MQKHICSSTLLSFLWFGSLYSVNLLVKDIEIPGRGLDETTWKCIQSNMLREERVPHEQFPHIVCNHPVSLWSYGHVLMSACTQRGCRLMGEQLYSLEVSL